MSKIRTSFSVSPIKPYITRGTMLTLMYALMTMAFIKPAHYIIGSTINKLWKLYTIFVCIFGVVMFLYLKRGKYQKRDSALLLFIFSYVVSYILSTLLNYRNANFFDAVQNTIETVGFICFVSAGLCFHTKNFFKGFLSMSVFWTFLHLCTILIYQDRGMRSGMNSNMGRSFSENWFLLTHANASYFIIIGVLSTLFVYVYTYAPKLKPLAWGYLLFAIFCFFTQWSVAGLIGFFVFAVFMASESVFNKFSIGSRKLDKRKLNLRLYILLCVLFDFMLTFGRLLEGMMYIFKKYFNKQHSLQARVTIWKRCIALLKDRFLIGFGWEQETVTILKTTYNHMHNVLLELLYRGGLLALIPFGAAVYISLFYKKKSGLNDQQSYRILAYSAIAFFLSANFDFYLYRYELLIIFIMFLYYDKIQQNTLFSNVKELNI